MIETLLHFNTFINALAVVFVFYGAARPHVFAEDPIIRYGALIACFGLLGQAGRNIQFFATGVSPLDVDAPYWMLKDLGVCMMILGYAMRGPIGKTLKGKK
jgi:hypothetical protein